MLKLFGRQESLEKSNKLVVLDLQIQIEEILSQKHEFLFGIHGFLYYNVSETRSVSVCCVTWKELTSVSEPEVNLRPTVSPSLCWCQAHIWDPRPIFLSPRNFF
jgi:hypothetical protein